MAGQFFSMQEVVDFALFRGDLEGMLERHPTVNVFREANMSYRKMRVKLANNDVPTVLSPTSILSLPVVEAVAGGGYAEIPWPTNFVSVHGLDVKVGGYWNTVPQGVFNQRRLGPVTTERGDYAYSDEGLTQWIVRNLPTTTTTTANAGAIMLFPVPTGGQYVLWGLPEWVDLVNGTDLFPGQESWIEWVINDLCCTLLTRDIGPQVTAQLQSMQAERERAWMNIKTNAQRLANDGPIQPLNRYGSMRSRGARMIP